MKPARPIKPTNLDPHAFAFSVGVTATEEGSFRLLGYRQTNKAAAKGGVANANYFRVRHGAMRSFAKSFAGMPLITGHDWGDTRARGGLVTKSWAEPIDGESMALYADIKIQAAWLAEGIENGTVDRFSIGAVGTGEVHCTVHNAPLWEHENCWCFPGEMVDGKLCELEHQEAAGREISAVNVPAVGGTGLVAVTMSTTDYVEKLAALCGRPYPKRDELSARIRGGFHPVADSVTISAPPTKDLKLNKEIAASLGLPETATEAEIQAKIASLQASATGLASQLQASNKAAEDAAISATAAREEIANVKAESAIGGLIASGRISAGDATDASLRSLFKKHGVDALLASVETLTLASARIQAPTEFTHVNLQSASKEITASAGDDGDGPDAFEVHKDNPHLREMMKIARLSVDDVKKHGSRAWNQVPGFRELVKDTEARGN